MDTALVLAAGRGTRTKLSANKIRYLLDSKPVFMHSVDKFLTLGFKIIIVAQKTDFSFIKSYFPEAVLVEGGDSRSQSVENGLQEVESEYVFIHDAARPFVAPEVIKGVKKLLNKYDAVLTCKKVTSTIYNKDLDVVAREQLIEAETPQAFLTEKIKQAYRKRGGEDYTDDISLFKKYNKAEIGLFYHETNNEKITSEKEVEKYLMPEFKIGHSYDIHQITKERKLILGGVEIPVDFGLLGHSDADVLLHAISEAILGALGLGDLGTFFPDTDQEYLNMDSQKILLFSKEKLAEKKYHIENIDASIYAEVPKLKPYITKMKENIARILKIDSKRINLKAGTNEKMDAIGQQKAIAAEAVCLVKRSIE